MNIDNDYRVVDDTESVIFHARLDDRTFAVGEIVSDVLARPIRAGVENVAGGRRVASSGMIATADIVFHVWRTNIAATPKARDELTDAGGRRWVVVQVDTQSLATRYRLFCARKR
ncbi:MAG: hypothetical protein AB7K24_05735 [Gemmataceae bacterium]